jgi:hypothetical protein
MHHFSSISEAGLDVFHPLWRRRIGRRFCLLICLSREEKDLSSVALLMHMSWWYGHEEISCWFYVDLNNAPIYWCSKRQGSVDSSTYQAESTQYIRALRYLLRLFEDLCVGDDQSVLSNTMYQGSTCLKKKCAAAAVAFHFVREGVTRRSDW